MFGSSARLEAQVQSQARELAQTATALNSHLNDCSRRYDQTSDSLDKLEGAIKESATERKADIKKLEDRVEQRHRENRKYFWLLLIAAVPVVTDKIVTWISTLQHLSH